MATTAGVTFLRQCGFCYVADSDAYIDEAMRSIASLRTHMPAVPIAFVAPPHLFRTAADVTDWVALEESRTGPIVKADAWRAPYERIVFLDTDTLIIGDLTGVFALLDRFDIAFVAEPNARPDHGLAAGVPTAFPEPNSGFFAFRKTADVRVLFDTWLDEYDLLRAQRGVTADQPALRIALWKNNAIRHLTLGSEYNLMPHTNPSVSGAVLLLHDRSPDRFRLATTVNEHIEPRAVIGGLGPLFGFISRRGWVRQFARLSWRFVDVLARPNVVRQQGHPAIWWRDGID